MSVDLQQLRAYLEYFRDLGFYDLYRRGAPSSDGEFSKLVAAARTSPASAPAPARLQSAALTATAIVTPRSTQRARQEPAAKPATVTRASVISRTSAAPSPPSADLPLQETPIGKLVSLNEVKPPLPKPFSSAERPAALTAVRAEIGDCTRCPLAYAGRHTIVFGEGEASAELMFVGEGPGADEDASGRPFVGKAGQLLNNMIGAMGLQREQVYIANIVKCRPPGNRVPEPAEANTCVPFLAEQIDIVRPKVIVALGLTAAMYLLGVRQSLGSLRGRWHDVRGAKVAVTYHPAFLLRDPRQKGEAWKDLQRVMAELQLKPPPAAAATS